MEAKRVFILLEINKDFSLRRPAKMVEEIPRDQAPVSSRASMTSNDRVARSEASGKLRSQTGAWEREGSGSLRTRGIPSLQSRLSLTPRPEPLTPFGAAFSPFVNLITYHLG